MSPTESPLLFGRVRPGLPRRDLRAFADRLREQVAGGRSFYCLLTTDRELQRLNREFLGKNYPTDVLSFPSGEPEHSLGEMAISVTRAEAQAREFGHPVDTEIKILMLHGLLHLLGMDHETDRGRMARAEREWRRKLSLPAGLIERVQA
jgi:probable rRNA maturation factor